MSDDVLDEVQRARQAYGERFHFDLEAIGRDLREQERRSGRTIVNYLSDRVESTEGGSSNDESAPTPASPVARAS
jgi:hypothetical protein